MALTEYEMRAGTGIRQRLERWRNHDNGQQMSLASLEWRSRAKTSLLLACTKQDLRWYTIAFADRCRCGRQVPWTAWRAYAVVVWNAVRTLAGAEQGVSCLSLSAKVIHAPVVAKACRRGGDVSE